MPNSFICQNFQILTSGEGSRIKTISLQKYKHVVCEELYMYS
jgi:hypothetical protein